MQVIRRTVLVVGVLGMCLIAYKASRRVPQFSSRSTEPNISNNEEANNKTRSIKNSLASKSCAPLKRIFFLKTHKCGSSTVQNILMRHGTRCYLNFVLPDTGTYLGHPEPFNISQIGSGMMDDEEHFDIFAHHTRFHAANVRSVMPPDTKKVTILRKPAAQFESLFNFFHMQQLFKNETSLATLLKIYDVEKLIELFDRRRLSGRLGRNQIAFDLGMDKKSFNDEEKIQELLRLVEVEFDLVLLSDYMEVSMVLLADLMCWSLEDVTFLKLHARPANQYHTILKSNDKKKLGELNNVDTVIYNHFRVKFQERVVAYGEDRMQADVRRLSELNEALMDECVEDIVPPRVNASRYRKPTNIYKLYSNAPPFCSKLILTAKGFTEQLREQQRYKFNTKQNLKLLLKEHY